MNQDKDKQRRQVWHEIDLFLEEFYPEGKRAGMLAAGYFDKEKPGVQLKTPQMKMAQIRGLENLVVSTRRFSEIINFIKNQAGKQNRTAESWRQVAGVFLAQLEQLEAKARELGNADAELVLDAKLRLARGWIKQVVAHYLFEQVRHDLGRPT
jgi:hypothetical protein